MTDVPIIDIDDPNGATVGLDRACRDHGFFLLRGHGLDDLIARTWVQSRAFFDADRSMRTAIARTRQNPLGHYDRELTKRHRDHKEVFDFIDPGSPARDAHNRWPDGLPGFRSTMAEFFESFSALAADTLTLIHDELGLDAGSRATNINSAQSSSVRLNHYTVGDPVPLDERDGLAPLGDTALGFHTDPGVLTLLLQDEVGGLQARSLDGDWIDVPPTPGTVVVNLGDCMQVWTNDRYRAAVHRVLPMSSERRFSIPYFSNPPSDAIIVPIAELAGAAPLYRSFPWREFSAARGYDNFTDLGIDDAQISDHRIR